MTPTLTTAPCEDQDMSRIFEIVSLAFGHRHQYFNAVFPRHDTPEGRKAGGERLLAVKRSDPDAFFFKAVDSATGVIVGAAKWIIVCDNNVLEEVRTLPAEYYGDGEAHTYAEYMWNEYLVPRRRSIRESGGNVVCLDLMAVDPAHQRRGAGLLLMEWGVAQSDALNVEAVVEASTEGRHLYEKFGYAVVEEIVMANPDRQAALPRQVYLWMRRPAATVPDARRGL